MPPTILVLLLAVAAAAAPDVAPSVSIAKHKLLTAAEIIRRLEASPVEYRVSELSKLPDVRPDQLPDLLWPLVRPPVALPRVTVNAAGERVIDEWPTACAAEPAIERAEAAYEKKDYVTAAQAYEEALKLAPDLYLIRASVGDCALFSGDPQSALEHYDRAIAQNPHDYRLYFYRANAHRKLRHPEQELEDLLSSLTLKPANPILLGSIRAGGKKSGFVVHDELLVPRALVRREGEAVGIYVEGNYPEWLAWASCKALWLGEPSHREEMLGSATPGWSTREEMECLGALVGVYGASRAKGKVPRDERLEQLTAVVNDGLAFGFVVYEIGSRVDPQLTLRVDAGTRDLVRRYIAKYVLTKAAPAQE